MSSAVSSWVKGVRQKTQEVRAQIRSFRSGLWARARVVARRVQITAERQQTAVAGAVCMGLTFGFLLRLLPGAAHSRHEVAVHNVAPALAFAITWLNRVE
jgi:hypothetical protein